MMAVFLIPVLLVLAASYLIGQYRSGAFTWHDDPSLPAELVAPDSDPPALKAA